MNEPASLAYLLIYNPTLPLPPNTSRDDEDAREEAHILFYTSRERAASRDRMLRQVGLAKALVNFSEIFAPGQGCDNVHSQTKRMVSVSPEPNFWMHACVDLARTLKLSKDKGKTAQSKDPPTSAYHYHENSLHNLALRHHLLRGYEAFKLLHGTFTSMLKVLGSKVLERRLEHFFTPWAWKWDLDSASEFGAHLGLLLHPLNKSLATTTSALLGDIPSNTIPLLLSPPYIIDPSQLSVAPYPPSLPAYLLSLLPPPGHPATRHKLNKGIDSSKSTGTTSRRGSVDTNTTSNTLGFFSAASAGVGEAMNPKKWSWPGSFAFGRNSAISQKKGDVGNSGNITNQSEKPIDSPAEASNTPTTEEQEGNDHAPQVPIHVSGTVDQHALDDAISETTPSLPDESPPVVENHVISNVDVPQSEQISLGASQRPPEEGPSFHPETTPSPPAPDLALSERAFSVLNIFLSKPSEPLIVQRRSVLYQSTSRLLFALLMDADWFVDDADDDLQVLGRKVPKFLEDIQQVIDTQDIHDVSATRNAKNAPIRTTHIISTPQSRMSSNAGFSSTSSQFFEGQETLARDAETIEVFSRSTIPQHWFVARQGLGFDKAGEKMQGEIYLEVGNKEASLVDADNELMGTMRRWSHGED